jgi:tetratricopeptide (TPR) repeat protein
LVDLVDGESVASKAGEWAEYVARKLRNNTNEIALVREPVEELTRLWLDDLNKVAEKSPIVLFFDTYERTSLFLDEWLRDVLGGLYGPLADTTQLVIAGRDELDRNRWSEYESVIARLSLEPFTEIEARDFLARKGIADERVIEVILHLSGRLPLLVATLAAERPDDPAKVGDPSGTAVERFLAWTEDSVLRRAALDAALPRRLDRDIIALLVDEQQVDRVFEWLKGMPFVEERGDGWVYHAVAREQMLRYKRRESQQAWAVLHEHLAKHYEQIVAQLHLDGKDRWRDKAWRAAMWEVIYHRLCQSPQVHLATALNRFLECRDATNLDETEQIIEPIAAATADTDEATLHIWTNHLRRLCAVARAAPSRATVEQWDTVARYPQLTSHNRAIAHTYKGVALRTLGQYDEAVAEISRAIACDAEYSWALASRGSVYRTLTRYEDALADLNRALAIRPRFVMALTERASVYRALTRYEEALTDLSFALEIHPRYAAALVRRGATYRVQQRYADALADIALALAQNPNDGWFLYQRALVYFLLGDDASGQVDLAAAIPLAQRAYEQQPENWYGTFSIVIYLLAAGEVAEAYAFYSQLVPRSPLYGLRSADNAFPTTSPASPTPPLPRLSALIYRPRSSAGRSMSRPSKRKDDLQ